MKKYETYKDSGLEWLGMVPEHWEIMKVKYICNVTDGTHFSPATISEGKPYITVSNVKDDFIDIENAGRISIADFNELVKQGCQPKTGDVLLAKDGTVGRTAIVKDNDYVVLSSLGILSPNDNLTSSYLKYMLDSSILQEQMNEAMAGSALRRITITKIKDFIALLPPTSEQRAIASYLDHKVGQIDALISGKEKMVEDLKAYRSSLITETVTKGLNKGVEMKDSGVEWIEKTPATWTTVLLKRCATIMTGGTPSTDIDRYWANPTFHWYTPSDFSDDDVVLNDSSRKLDKTAIKEHAAKLFPQNSVLVVGIGATLGKVGISLNECSSNQQVNAIIFNPTVLPEYGAYYLLAGKEYIRSQSNAATLPILNQSTMGELQIVVPTIDEQKDIVGFINKKVSVIKESIENLQIQISDLKSYKSSLITEAVTGKIDLIDWQTKKS